MALLSLLLLLLPLAAQSYRIGLQQPDELVTAEVCYEGLGCFSNDGKFFDWIKRPIFALPASPEKIATKFTLFTRATISLGREIVYNDKEKLAHSYFSSRRRTKILIHGFWSDPSTNWMLGMKDALLKADDCNVLIVDWSGGNKLPYTQATVNTRVVGAQVAQLLRWLELETQISISMFHVIGHSLGAHAGGYAGDILDGKIGRITGMDPAGPYFSGTDPVVRLDPTDALFVDVIHTDAVELGRGGFGLFQPLGHIDFYPNGGKEQPGCTKNPIVSITENGKTFSITCNHKRVSALITGTIANPFGQYKAVECRSYSDFKQGKCTCENSDCANMGLSADKWRPNGRQNVKMFLDTTSEAPFSAYQYVVKVTLSKSAGSVWQFGDLYLELEGATGTRSGRLTLLDNTYLNPGQTVTAVLSTSANASSIRRVRFEWKNRYIFPIQQKKLFIDRAEIQEWGNGRKTLHCGHNAGIESAQSLWIFTSSSCS